MQPARVLKKYFGYDTFREHPLEVIQKIRAGIDAFVLKPTGIGKSICCQIRSLSRFKRISEVGEQKAGQIADAFLQAINQGRGGSSGKHLKE